ncbi:MAG: substrate-binding domain-containing protein [Burkholderiaceae bacterium]
MKIDIQPSLSLIRADQKPVSLVRGMSLLRLIEKGGNLHAASNALGISYRMAWDTLTEMETLFGAPVIDGTPGRGSELTALGKRLVHIDKLVHARIGPLLEAMETEIEAEIQSAVSATNASLRICASHDFAVEALYKRLYRENVQIDLSYRGSLESLIALSRGSCDIAGFHVPIGALERPVWRQFEPYLSSDHAVINLATRRQAIMVAKGNPKNIWSVQDLMREGVQFVNRQQGAGTRMILDLLLAQEGKDGRAIHGYENIEMTHAAVGAYILCGKADAGLGVEAAARQFDLDFVPLLSERYFLACEKSLLQQPGFAPLMSALRAKDFQMEVNRLAGYDGINLGKVEEAADIAPPAA